MMLYYFKNFLVQASEDVRLPISAYQGANPIKIYG